MATNNNNHLLDSASNVAVDFVWGPFPMQPNDDRYSSDWATPVTTAVVAANAAQNNGWSGWNTYPAVHLNPNLANHAVEEAAYAGFPAFIPAGAKYLVTAASADGTTVTYTAQNGLNAGDTVTITGLTTGAFNLSSVTVASANAVKFTVTNTATGTAVTGGNGVATNVTNAAAEDGAYIAGVFYIDVPSVLGQTTALAVDALRDSGYEAASITTASGATNTAKTITAAARTLGTTTATLTASGAGAAYPVGTKITVASLVSPADVLNGDWTVTATGTNTVSFTSTGTSAVSTSGISVAGLTGKSGTIKTQSTAGGAASVLTTDTITITPWA